MEINFNENTFATCTQRAWRTRSNHFQPQIVKKYIRVIDLMRDEDDVLGLVKYNSLHYERLTGNKYGLSSVRVNDQCRIEFEEETEEGNTIATICNITELSNHYE